MFIKKCCIESCKSSSSRPEDVGVTFHKFPKDHEIRQSWILVTRQKYSVDIPVYVCSRHFCKSDFQNYQDSKYILKSDSIPSIFNWRMSQISDAEIEDKSMETEDKNWSTSSSSKDFEENVDAIKKFMEQQEKDIKEHKEKCNSNISPETIEEVSNKSDIDMINHEQPHTIGTSVLNMILTESETMDTKKAVKPFPKHTLTSEGSVALSVGSKVEAKDYGDIWYAAEILEVDCDEMEVLVHYETVNKHDEWISVNSSRLRPIGVVPKPVKEETSTATPTEAAHIPKEEMPDDKDKPKPTYTVGERCLARWRDNRRFVATIAKDLENGVYEIIFDDGFHWKCNTSRLYKLKSSTTKGTESLTIDTSVYPSSSTPSPILAGVGPSSGALNTNPNPPFHTHLFDPTRDYLGSKTERREMKRKLNIKEIFNIGQKKRKKSMLPREKTVRIVRERKRKRGWRRKIKQETDESSAKPEIPEAVASIIGTIDQEKKTKEVNKEEETKKIKDVERTNEQAKDTEENTTKPDKTITDSTLEHDSSDISDTQTADNNTTQEPASEEEVKLEKFEKPDEVKHEEVMDKIKEAINKLEGGLVKTENIEKLDSPKPEITEVKEEKIEEHVKEEKPVDLKDEKPEVDVDKPKKKLSKIKKSKKLRLLQEKKVKKQVEKVKNELQEMKRQFEEMRQQMLKKTEELATAPKHHEMPESFLLPGEWCCKWVNGQPVGTVSELEAEPKFDANNKMALPRRSVQVEDKRLPEGWTKHMVRRSLGQSAGKWDVVLVGPDNRRFHTKTDMRNYLETNKDEFLKHYEGPLLDFGVHLKLARRMGWVKNTGEETPPPTAAVNSTSPLIKRKKMNINRTGMKKEGRKEKKKRLKLSSMVLVGDSGVEGSETSPLDSTGSPADEFILRTALEDGYMFVGSLKVQIIDNLLRCPADGCFKNFRNSTLIKMHIKHYHRELRKMLGATPKVLDLAYARAKPTAKEAKKRHGLSKVIKVKLPKLSKKDDAKPKLQEPLEPAVEPTKKPERLIPRSLDSPKLRQVLANKPVKRPKVLLPVRRPEEPIVNNELPVGDDVEIETSDDITPALDFELSIATHTVTKPLDEIKKKKKLSKKTASDDEWFGMNSDFDTRSSWPGSGTPDYERSAERAAAEQPAYESTEEQRDANMYIYTENGERVKIEHMKREEIINCHCGYREEDGLMVQCELCLCWQHALCHNIHREAEVPEKYTCSICLNPKRGRRSKRFLHDQDRLYEGLLPGAKPCESLRRSHELSGNLLRIQDALHALRVKYYVATKKNHPKLYLWAKDWENAEITMTQEKLNSDYSDLNIIINNMRKETAPLKTEDMKDLQLELRSSPEEEHRESLLSLTAALASPGGNSLDLPISTADLERLAKSVQEQENVVASGPQPEAAIEGGACRERLLRHLQRCHALIDARLDSIEAQVAELESQDPSFEDDETAEYFPRTKQTIQMLMRDLDTMEELGIIT